MSEFILPGRADSPVALSSMRRWAVMCHLSWLLGFVIPFGSIIGPLIVWLAKRHDYYEVDVHGKEALNFQITWVFYGAIFGGLVWILAFGLNFPLGNDSYRPVIDWRGGVVRFANCRGDSSRRRPFVPVSANDSFREVNRADAASLPSRVNPV